jgi:hypothetical protein
LFLRESRPAIEEVLVPHCQSKVNLVQPEKLYFALNETTHALRFAESAAKHFTVDPDELETGSPTATSTAFIKNRLLDSQGSLAAAELEIRRLLQLSRNT